MGAAVAVDWSGDIRAESEPHPKLWVAEAVDGRLVALAPSSRAGAVLAVLHAADRHGPGLVAGLDFSFSYPAWFLAEAGIADGPDLWDRATRLAFDQPPFFGWKGSRAPQPERRYRRTEADLRTRGIHPSSSFQVGGAGAVGTGTRRGLPHLATLRAAGLDVWPFDADDGARPLVVELYPRLCTGPVVKSSASGRERWWADAGHDTDAALRALALASEDAFDAAASALAISRGTRPWRCPEPDVALVEGWIADAGVG